MDELIAPLERAHAGRLRCARGCHACCLDDLSVLQVEADRILDEAPALLAEGLPHPPGACAFLDAQGACRIYSARPYVCRTQGLPLRWGAERDGQLVEARDICPLNEGGVPVEQLPDPLCWTLGPVEQRLDAAQAAHGVPGARVPLRSLFRRQP
ncbi:MAG: YkgJ family cysteine cluster protein [Deltaproteobacteria bacterium]|nr:YkgJ family cysteine cluster protein [Deltaproteobacteria bacterium]